MPWRRQLYRQLFQGHPGDGLSAPNRLLLLLVLLAVAVQVLETEPVLMAAYPRWFQGANLAMGLLFCLDYLLRLWAAGGEEAEEAWVGRLRHAFSWGGLADLAAVLPFLMASHPGAASGNDLFFLRLVLLVKLVRLSGMGPFGMAIRHFTVAISRRRYELTATLLFSLTLMLLLATAMYLVEGGIQPQAFGSIPRAFWWSVMTLTTVGYGDVVPVTPLGKVLGGLAALVGIGLVALPTGLLASAFAEAFQKGGRRES